MQRVLTEDTEYGKGVVLYSWPDELPVTIKGGEESHCVGTTRRGRRCRNLS